MPSKLSKGVHQHLKLIWNANDLLLVGVVFINAALSFAVLYVNLAIYLFLYIIVSNLIKWIQCPSIPISMKSKQQVDMN